MDLFVSSGEMSGDLHGASLIEELLKQRPCLKIGAVCGPKMRRLPIQSFFKMEDLAVMGFLDVLFALPKIIRQFFAIRNQILALNPKVVLFIDYPGFHLRLAKSLKKKGFKGKLIHFICPSVWAWGKKRIPLMAKTLDLLLVLFPFEVESFSSTSLPTLFVGHPLTWAVSQFRTSRLTKRKILGVFPGSRKTEIARNLPLQLRVANRLKQLESSLEIIVSDHTHSVDENYELMRSSHMAIATSGTVTLELALHGTPTVVNFAIKPLDRFIAQKIFLINLPFYCIVNIIQNKSIFPELFGPNLTEENLFFWAQKLWFDEEARQACQKELENLRKSLGVNKASETAAAAILEIVS